LRQKPGAGLSGSDFVGRPGSLTKCGQPERGRLKGSMVAKKIRALLESRVAVARLDCGCIDVVHCKTGCGGLTWLRSMIAGFRHSIVPRFWQRLRVSKRGIHTLRFSARQRIGTL